jgi:hypothetical protein
MLAPAFGTDGEERGRVEPVVEPAPVNATWMSSVVRYPRDRLFRFRVKNGLILWPDREISPESGPGEAFVQSPLYVYVN